MTLVPVRHAQTLAARIIRRARWLVFVAPPLICDAESIAPPQWRLARINADSTPEHRDLMEQAMQRAGEAAGLAAPRWVHGDECFAWLATRAVTGDQSTEHPVLGFGWVTYHDRLVCGIRLQEAPGRVFLYNFHTCPTQRGRGCYPLLLGAIRHQLGGEGVREFIIDARTRNTASVSGIGKAGFDLIAQADFIVWLDRWFWLRSRTELGPMPRHVFRP